MSAIAAAVIGGGAALVGGYMSANAAEDAARMQSDSASQQMALQKQIFDVQNAQQAPYRGTGYTALNQIGSLLPGQYQQYDTEGQPTGTGTGTGYLTKEFTNLDLNQYLTPNYAFQLGQGQGALRNQQNATGGLIGGNALQGMQDYTQNFAQNAYQNAFSNFQGQRTNIYNTLAGIAGIGQTANQASNTLATNYGTNMANLGTGQAAAEAAGRVGAANAYSGGIQSAGNMFMLSNLLGQRGTVPGYTGGYSSGGGVGMFTRG